MALLDRVLSLLGLDFDLSFDDLEAPFHTITPALLLGSRPRREALPALRKHGVTHVVSCLPEADRASVAFLRDALAHLFLPLRDGVHEDISAVMPEFFAFVSGAGPKARVLVHCEVGVSRSAALVIAHIMQAERLRFYAAYQKVRTRRAQVLPNIGFATQLQRFEDALFPGQRPAGPSSLARYLREVCSVPIEIEVIHDMLESHDGDAVRALQATFGGEIPRVVQGVRR